MFRDRRSYLAYIDTVRRQPQPLSDDDRSASDAEIAALREWQQWIITQANAVCSATTPITPRDFWRRTSDTRIVETAGGALGPDALGDGWDPALSLLSTWRRLSGYAHATPWSSVSHRVIHGGPDPVTGQVTVSQTGDPEILLDAAFRAVIVVENAISRYDALSS
jgi:hypothetical protein